MMNHLIREIRKIFRQRSGESGFTLIEMLVAMTIASVFFASFTAVVIATVQTLKTGDQRTVAQQNSRIAVNFMADEIKQMKELEPPSFSEYRDLKTGGLPRNGEVVDEFYNEVYPIYRQSTDGSARGYIDLENANASGGQDEYEDFRTDGMPFDVRPLFPNKLNFIMNQSEFFPHTRYSSMNPNLAGEPIDLDGLSFDLINNSDNTQSGSVRVSYEHQKQPPRMGLLRDSGGFLSEGFLNDLYLPIQGGAGGGVNLFKKPFVLLRSFELENVTGANPNSWGFNDTLAFHGLIEPDGTYTGIDLTRPSEDLRQIIADHIVDVRFRYFHVRAGEMIEIRYDPYNEHMGQDGGDSPDNVNDGYYRYYDQHSQEIYSWAISNGDPIDIPDPTDDVVEEYKSNYPDDWTFLPTNEFERGILLFEGWRFVNTIMITIKGANTELQETYYATVSHEITNLNSGFVDHPDYGLGFVDFQKGTDYLNDMQGLNSADPLWHALDSYREGVGRTNGGAIYDPPIGTAAWNFDFVEPNSNAAFDPGRFVTLQTMVTPPVLDSTARKAAAQLTYGLSYL